MKVTPAMKRGMVRFARVVWIPALIAVLDSVIFTLQAGSLVFDAKLLAIAFLQALVLGCAKWLRDELAIDVKVA